MLRNLLRNCTHSHNTQSNSPSSTPTQESVKATWLTRKLENIRQACHTKPSSHTRHVPKIDKNFCNHFSKSTVTGLERRDSAERFLNLWEHHSTAVQKQSPNAYGFKKLKASDKRIYYIDRDNTVIYRGHPIQHGRQGTWKLHRYGNLRGDNKESYIGLIPKKQDFTTQKNKDGADIRKLHLSAVVVNRVVEDDLMIAPYAGEDINNSFVPLAAFLPALSDLETLHQHHIYLRDIKLDNMAFDKNKGTSGQVNLIDIDNRVHSSPDQPFIEKPFYTPRYITQGLIDGAYFLGQYNQYIQASYLRTADEYAFLLCLIEATTEDADLHRAITHPKIDLAGGPYPGVRNNTNDATFDAWITTYIEPTYVPAIKALLTDPATFSQLHPDHPSLMTMLNQDFRLDRR